MIEFECDFKQVGYNSKAFLHYESLKMSISNQLKGNSRDIRELEIERHQKQRNLIKEQMDLFAKKKYRI